MTAAAPGRAGRWLEGTWHDLREALRALKRAPALTTVIVLTLALGIGVNAAIFTLFRLFDRSLPGAGTLVRFETRAPGEPADYAQISYPEYVHLRERSETLSAVATASFRPMVVSGGVASEIPPLVLGEFVSDAYFDVFDVPLVRGRAFTREESATPGREPLVVLSHDLWQRYFGGRADIIGRSMFINGLPFVVVGVAGPDFVQPGFNWKGDLWLPLTMRGRLYPDADQTADASGMAWYDRTDLAWMAPYARLAPGRTVDEARAEIRVLLGQLRNPHAQRVAQRIDVAPITVLGGPGVSASLGRIRAIAMAATAIVLLIVCTNIAALLLARATSARKELAVRLCLGASRGRIARQFLAESLLLAAIGGAGGLLLAWWSLRAFLATSVFTALGRDDLSPIARLHVTPDLTVLAFTLGVSFLGCLLFGLLPAWRATSGDLLPSVKDATGVMGRDGGRSRLRSGLVVAQAALSLVLLIATGLLLRGIDRVQQIEPGIDPQRTLLLTVWMRQARYDTPRAQQFYRDLEERLRALPGVRAVARAENIPGIEDQEPIQPIDDTSPHAAASARANATTGSNTTNTANATSATSPMTQASATAPIRGFVNVVTPSFFDVTSRGILRGRVFTEDEQRRGDAVVVTESIARRLWPDRDPLQQRVAGPTRGVARVVGVAREATDFFGEPRPMLYVPLDPGLDADRRARVLIRTSGDAASLLSVVRTTAHAVDPALHMVLETMADQQAGTAEFRLARTASALAASLGLLALVLASLGFYGVMAFMVSRRTREIGVRMALGAGRADVRRLVLGHGLRLGLVGVALGLAGGAGAARVLSSILFGLSPFDPVAYGGASLLLMAIVLLACLIPARRAMRVNPIVSLRYE